MKNIATNAEVRLKEAKAENRKALSALHQTMLDKGYRVYSLTALMKKC